MANSGRRSGTPKSKTKSPYVKSSTIWKGVGGGFSYPGAAKVYKVGKYRVLVSRAENLDRYGNPVHTATLLGKNGTLLKSYKSNGSATLVVSNCLKKNGIGTKFSK